MWVETLLDAIAVLLGEGDNPKRDVDKAERWLSRYDDRRVGSFIWICESLNLPCNQIRRTVSRMMLAKDSADSLEVFENVKEAMYG